MRHRTYAAIALLIAVAACSASGAAVEPKPDPGAPDGDAAAPIDDTGPLGDASPDVDLDAERPLICGDAGFCETKLPRSDLGVPLSLRSVWMAGSKDVWSVTLEGIVLHHDGTRWSIAYRANHELYAVWATPTSVWVGGEAGLLLHRSAAGEWSRVETGHMAPIRAIYGTNDNDVWFTRQDSSVDHFDGTTLKNHATGISGLEITTVFGRPGFGTYAAGRVNGDLPGSGILPDQPYVLALSTANIAVFNTSLTEKRSFVPLSGFVTDSPNDDQRILLAGPSRFRLVRSGVVSHSYTMKYCVIGSNNSAEIESLTNISSADLDPVMRQDPAWAIPALVRQWDDIRLVAHTSNLIRWDGSAFKTVSLGMGYDHPTTVVFGAHNDSTDAWMVGDGFALKGAMP
jgi:hypothetical protein